MKTQIITQVLSASLLLYSCGTSSEPSKEEHNDDHDHSKAEAHEHVFACPMHPEVTGNEGESCPKCGMKLEHHDINPNEVEKSYFMQYSSVPTEIESGKEAVLSFSPKIKGSENEPVALDVVHEKKIHLIIASKDLSYFEHIHPEMQANGNYEIKVLAKGKPYSAGKGKNETYFDFGGEYIMFPDYTPTGGVHQMENIPLTVKGTPYKNVSYTKASLSSKTDGYEVSLESGDNKWVTNKQMHIKATIKQNGKTIDANTFENYLGAKSHMVVLKTETFEYLHVHPEVEDGNLDLHATFESPGTYRGWLQFQTDGKVHIADFVIVVEQGSETVNSDGHNHTHSH